MNGGEAAPAARCSAGGQRLPLLELLAMAQAAPLRAHLVTGRGGGAGGAAAAADPGISCY